MAETLMALGFYRFSIDTAAYNELERIDRYRWPTQPLIGQHPAAQFTGFEAPEVTLKGTVYPHWAGGLGQIEAMRSEAASGNPLELVDGLGRVWGLWSITEIRETQGAHLDNSAPRRQTFEIKLQYFGEDDSSGAQQDFGDQSRNTDIGITQQDFNFG